MINNFWIIAFKDIKEVFRSRTTYLYFFVPLLITFSLFNGLSASLNQMSAQGSSNAAMVATAQTTLGIMVSTLPLVFNMLFSNFLSNYAVVTDKSKRVLESLLATPLTLRQVWAGKALSIALPSLAVSLVLSAGALVVMNELYVVPEVGHFVMPSGMNMVTGWILVPVISFLVALLVVLFQLILSNPRIANFAFMIMFFAVFIVPAIPALRSLNLELIYLLLIGALVLLNLSLSPVLTKERVILSSKG
jgi:ABC-2 type transport system permease protein